MALKSDQPSGLVSLRIPTDVLSEIDRIAAIAERSRSWIIVRALKTYLRDEGQRIVDSNTGKSRLPRTELPGLDDLIAELRSATADERSD